MRYEGPKSSSSAQPDARMDVSPYAQFSVNGITHLLKAVKYGSPFCPVPGHCVCRTACG